MKILLHVCCGPCALYPLAALRSEGLAVSGWFFNHNIHPYQEYLKRRDAARRMAQVQEMELLEADEYRLEEFLANVAEKPENAALTVTPRAWMQLPLLQKGRF